MDLPTKPHVYEPASRNFDMYKHLNDDKGYQIGKGVPITVPMQVLAMQIFAQNYGLHRFLCEIVKLGRAQQAERQAEYDAKGDTDIKATTPLIDAIEAAINAGHTY